MGEQDTQKLGPTQTANCRPGAHSHTHKHQKSAAWKTPALNEHTRVIATDTKGTVGKTCRHATPHRIISAPQREPKSYTRPHSTSTDERYQHGTRRKQVGIASGAESPRQARRRARNRGSTQGTATRSRTRRHTSTRRADTEEYKGTGRREEDTARDQTNETHLATATSKRQQRARHTTARDTTTNLPTTANGPRRHASSLYYVLRRFARQRDNNAYTDRGP